MTGSRRKPTAPRLGALDRIPTPMPARYAHVRQRRHVRCIISPEHPLFAAVTPIAHTQKPCRTVALDMSLGGMAVEVIEPYALGLPDRDDDVSVAMDLDGLQVELRAHVMSSSVKKIRMRFLKSESDTTELQLMLLLADVVTLGMRSLDRTRASELLTHGLGFWHFVGNEHLDIRIHDSTYSDVAPWWQMRFLDYIINWTERDGFTCAATDRREDLAEPLAPPNPATMRAVARRLARRGERALPQRAAGFGFVLETLSDGREPSAAPP